MHRFFTFSLVLFLFLLIGGYLGGLPHIDAILLGYLLSFFFVGSNYLVVHKTEKWKESDFYRLYFISLAARFVLVITALLVVLLTTKFHQIYFTVSFIISYILHSVIEIISFNKNIRNR